MDEREDLSHRRQDDITIVEVATMLRDHIDRYERDMTDAKAGRSEIIAIIKSHDEFIRDIKPIYNRGMIALGAFALGSIGVAVHTVWSHIKWG